MERKHADDRRQHWSEYRDGRPGLRIDPYQSCNFVVEIEGLLVGGFASVRGSRSRSRVHEYREGGQNDFMHRFAGAREHPPLVLKHGCRRSMGFGAGIRMSLPETSIGVTARSIC